MRKSIIITAALGLSALSANAQNLMQNGSFEIPGPGFLLLEDWINFGNVFTDIGGVEVLAQDGTTAVKMFGASSGSQSDQVLLQTVGGITPGEQYTLSGYVLNPLVDALGDENIILFQMNFQDAGGNNIEQPEVVGFDNASDPFDTWIESSVSGIAPPGTSQITVALLHIQLGADAGFPTQGGGATFWDNVTLVEGGDVPCSNPADFNNDGVLDFFDISAFLQEFSAGCP